MNNLPSKTAPKGNNPTTTKSEEQKKFEEEEELVPVKSKKIEDAILHDKSGLKGSDLLQKSDRSEEAGIEGPDAREREIALELEMRREMQALGVGGAPDEEEEEEEDDESVIDVEDEAQLAARGLRKIMIEGEQEPFLLDMEGNIYSMNGDFLGTMGGGGEIEEGEDEGFEEEDEEDLLP